MQSILAQVISRIESSDNPHAMRFESEIFNRQRYESNVPRIQSIHRCSTVTARMISATSFGAFQIMGFNLYAPGGIQCDIADYMGNPVQQLASFKRFLQLNGLDESDENLLNQDKRLRFARVYNGDATGTYAMKMLTAYTGLR